MTGHEVPHHRINSVIAISFVSSTITELHVPERRSSSILTITLANAIETVDPVPAGRSSSILTAVEEGNIAHDLCNGRNVSTEIVINKSTAGRSVITTFEDAAITGSNVPRDRIPLLTVTFEGAIITEDNVPGDRHNSIVTIPFGSPNLTGHEVPWSRGSSILTITLVSA